MAMTQGRGDESTNDLFTAFYKPLHQAALAGRSGKENEVDYLDQEAGIALQWAASVSKNLEELSNNEATSSDDRASYIQEANTWLLLQSLYLHRTQYISPEDPSSSKSVSTTFRYTPPLGVIQQAIAEDGALSELSIVRDWLHTTAYSSLQPAEVRRGYLPYTKNRLKHALRTNPESLEGDKLVTELDPDAPNRLGTSGKRKAIDSEDANYEKALLRSFFEYVRVGELDQAMDMARQSDNSWRAASLSGGKLFEDAMLSHASRTLKSTLGADDKGDMMDFRDTYEPEDALIQGNLRRKLWKKACQAIVKSEHSDSYERALYGAVSGDETSVLAVAQSWEDHLWARINSLIEAQIDAILTKAEDNYFLSSQGSQDSIEGEGTVARLSQSPISSSLQSIFNGLLSDPKLHLDSRTPFHVAQSWIILNRTSDLLNSFVAKLEESSDRLEESNLAQLLRFFTHLILFYRLILPTASTELPPLPEDSSAAIIEGYISVLQAHGASPELIAFYCTALDQQQATDVYSRYLHAEFSASNDTEPDEEQSDRAQRYAALQAAASNGLHISDIVRRVTELTVDGVSANLPDFAAATASFGLEAILASTQASDREVDLIRSVEWLTFDDSTHREALAHANALIRYFLCAGSPSLASRVLYQIPPTLLSAASQDDDPSSVSPGQVNEFLDHTSLFDALRLHMRFTEIWSRRPTGKSASRSELMRFSQGLQKITDDLWKTFVDLMTSDWLIIDPEEEELDSLFVDAARRREELRRIRAAYLPELVFRLHSALVLSGEELIPSNVDKALQLSTIVADEKHRLYLEFLDIEEGRREKSNRMMTYLRMMREASLLRLRHKGDVQQRTTTT